MAFDERLAELGVDLSDLPKNLAGGPEPYPLSMLSKANGAAWNWYLDIGSDMENYDSTRSKMVLKLYILHLTDIIDRMETRLVNVTGELNYIKANFKDCATCTDGHILHSDRCPTCDEYCYSNYEFAEVPEDWRPDDD